MDEGFVIDRGDYDSQTQSSWTPGRPRESWWRGTVSQIPDAKPISIITLRCPTCGYLESYAPPPKP